MSGHEVRINAGKVTREICLIIPPLTISCSFAVGFFPPFVLRDELVVVTKVSLELQRQKIRYLYPSSDKMLKNKFIAMNVHNACKVIYVLIVLNHKIEAVRVDIEWGEVLTKNIFYNLHNL